MSNKVVKIKDVVNVFQKLCDRLADKIGNGSFTLVGEGSNATCSYYLVQRSTVYGIRRFALDLVVDDARLVLPLTKEDVEGKESSNVKLTIVSATESGVSTSRLLKNKNILKRDLPFILLQELIESFLTHR